VIKKKDGYYGPGVVTDRDNPAFPHKKGYLTLGAEGPKRKTPIRKTPVKSTKIPIKPKLTDKYGRKISRAEFNKREKYRESLRTVPKAVRGKTTALKQAESKRRREYRSENSGVAYNIISHNKDMPKGMSSRSVNATSRAVGQKTVGTSDSKSMAASASRSKAVTAAKNAANANRTKSIRYKLNPKNKGKK